jgi:hypothetical protein
MYFHPFVVVGAHLGEGGGTVVVGNFIVGFVCMCVMCGLGEFRFTCSSSLFVCVTGAGRSVDVWAPQLSSAEARAHAAAARASDVL